MFDPHPGLYARRDNAVYSLRMSLRSVWYTFLSACALAVFLPPLFLWYQHRNDPDIQITAIHAVVDCIPFLASILFALWPEVSKAHISLRVLVLIGGLAWSGLLARKDYLDLLNSRSQEQNAIMTAVNQSNAHTDTEIGQVRDQLKDVQKDIKDTTSSLNDKLATLSGQVSKSETDLGQTIGQVLIPQPKYARLQFSFLAPKITESPLLTKTLIPDADGVYTLDIVLTNVSDTTANIGEAWLQICDTCTFAKEPAHFDKPEGSIDQVRHLVFQALNPGASVKMTAAVKPAVTLAGFTMSLRYSCSTCGKMADAQQLTILRASP